MSMNSDDDFRARPSGMDPEAHTDALHEGLDDFTGRYSDGGILFTLVTMLLVGITVLVPWNVPGWVRAIAIVCAMVGPAFVFATFRLRKLPSAMGRAMRAHGADVCSACGYSLRGLPGVEKCPECGIFVRAMVPIGSSRRRGSPIVMPPGLRQREENKNKSDDKREMESDRSN